MKRKNFEISAGSMADIAFLLLIFFLVSTTIEKDKGYIRNLPEKLSDPRGTNQIKEENLLDIQINDENKLLVRGQLSDFDQLKSEIRTFYMSNSPLGQGNQNYPLWSQNEKHPKYLGLNKKAVIGIKAQNKTEYKTYIEVQSCLQEVVHEFRNEICNHYFNVSYDYLLEHREAEIDRINIIHSIVPIRIIDQKIQ